MQGARAGVIISHGARSIPSLNCVHVYLSLSFARLNSDSGVILILPESLKIVRAYDLLSNYELNGLCLVKYG